MNTSAAKPLVVGPSPAAGQLPPLESGDHLTAADFDRIYEQRHDLRADLIEGVVYVKPLTRAEAHGRPHGQLAGWAGAFTDAVASADLLINPTLHFAGDNRVQPDVVMACDLDRDEASRLTPDGFLVAPVELIAEVAVSWASIEFHDKFELNRRSGVREYLVWAVDDRELHWFWLRGGRFEPLPLDGGILKSQVLPGLWLDADALVRNDKRRIRDILQSGLASPEHAAFVQSLQAKLPRPG